MAQVDRLVKRIQARPADMNFSDVQTLLEAFGWTKARQRGSHMTYVKAGEAEILVIKRDGGKVYDWYLNKIRKALHLDD